MNSSNLGHTYGSNSGVDHRVNNDNYHGSQNGMNNGYDDRVNGNSYQATNEGLSNGVNNSVNDNPQQEINHGFHQGRTDGMKNAAINHHHDSAHHAHQYQENDRENGREKRREKKATFNIDSGEYNRRPSFGQWIKFTWLDILTMVIMGIIGLGVYNANPAPSRSFPVTFSDGQIVYPEFAYPLRKEIVPIWLAALLGSLIPIAIILCMQIRIRSFWDVNNAVIGLLYSLITAAVFQVFLKWLIGGLRPHFLSVCDPDPALLTAGGSGFGSIMFQRNICRGDANQINDSLESFPSGHSTAAWAGFLFLYYYLNAKLKVFSNYHPAMWKIIALYAPLLGATLISGALTIDEFHNWYDIVFGAIIGSVFATSAYRMVYASVWDFRFNHIPLTRHTPFSFGAGAAGAGGFESAVFTRQAGWGVEEALGGAPFDAAHGLRGQAIGFNNGADGIHHARGIMGHNKKSDDVEHSAAGKIGHGNNSNRARGFMTGIIGDRDLRHSRDRRVRGGILRGIIPGKKHHDNTRSNHHNDTYETRRDRDYDRGGNNRGEIFGGTMDGTTQPRVSGNRDANYENVQDGSYRNNPDSFSVGNRDSAFMSNRDNDYAQNESTTPTRGRYHSTSRSIERKAVPKSDAANTLPDGKQQI